MTAATGAKAPPTGRLPVGETITRAALCSLTPSRSPLQIRPYEAADWPAVWALLEPVFRAGETFPHDPAITRGRGPGGVGGAEPGGDGGRGCGRGCGGHLLPEAQLPRSRRPCGQCRLRGGRALPPPGDRQPPLPALAAGGAAAGVPGDAVQPGGEHQHRRHPLLAAQRLSGGRHPAGGVPPQAAGLCRCPGDGPGTGGGAEPHEGGAAAAAAGRRSAPGAGDLDGRTRRSRPAA